MSAQPPRFLPGPVTVEVPATSANLGPGFDCLGVALDRHDTLVGEVVPEGLDIGISGEGAGRLPRTERHLVVRAMYEVFAALDVEPSGLRLRFTNRIPQSRGLGSSSAAIVGGLVLARGMVADGCDLLNDAALLVLANRLEGHPDNVAAALLGGLVVSGQSDDDVWAAPALIDPAVSAVVFVPPTSASTKMARGVLPDVIDHTAAAANVARATLLLTALAGRPEHLWRGTEDFLHQRYRAVAMPESYDLVVALRADGVAAIISGAGPTVLAFTIGSGADLEARCPAGWQAWTLAVDHRGARVL